MSSGNGCCTTRLSTPPPGSPRSRRVHITWAICTGTNKSTSSRALQLGRSPAARVIQCDRSPVCGGAPFLPSIDKGQGDVRPEHALPSVLRIEVERSGLEKIGQRDHPEQ